MSAMLARDKPGSLLQAIWRWFRTRSDRAGRDLMALSDREVERIAEDLSVSTAELYKLARSDSRSADLLKQRMAALDLDCEEVARLMPETMHDLQRLCTFCRRQKRCARDLARTPLDPRWKDYCPNVATLSALDAMPWAARGEW
jgi:hypothetical protein